MLNHGRFERRDDETKTISASNTNVDQVIVWILSLSRVSTKVLSRFAIIICVIISAESLLLFICIVYLI